MNYATSFLTAIDNKACFTAITKEISKWWGKVDQSTGKLGDEFSIFFGTTEWRFRITHYEPFEKITWHCIKANHVHEGLQNIKTEWLDTEIEWTISEEDEKQKISFIHKGLTNQLNCYGVCKAGWDYYLLTSLKSYLETGEGSPYST